MDWLKAAKTGRTFPKQTAKQQEDTLKGIKTGGTVPKQTAGQQDMQKRPESAKPAAMKLTDLKPGCRIICQTTDDENDAYFFLDGIVDHLQPKTIISYCYNYGHECLIGQNDCVEEILDCQFVDGIFVWIDSVVKKINNGTQVMVFVDGSKNEVHKDEKLPQDVSRLLELSRPNVSVVMLTSDSRPDIASIDYYFQKDAARKRRFRSRDYYSRRDTANEEWTISRKDTYRPL